MTLTKDLIIKSIQDQLELPKTKSAELFESTLEIIKKSLENDEGVLISGFGKFCIKNKDKRRGRNPATGEDLILGPRKVVIFKCSGVLRDEVNGKR